MNSRIEVSKLLKQSGNLDLWSDDVFNQAKVLTKKVPDNLKVLFENLEGSKEKYMHDLIVANRDSIVKGR